MLRLIAFGLATGAGIQAWRNWPADGPVSTSAGVTMFVLGIVCAYVGGRWRGRGSASATATAVAVATSEAHATAQQSVQVALILPGRGAGSSTRVPDEAVAWFGGARGEVTADDLEGFDLAELVSESDPESVV